MKENTVELYGRINEDPKIRVNTKGEYVYGRFTMHTVRRSSASRFLILQGDYRWDFLPIVTKNKSMIENAMLEIEEGDMVFVKGTLCTYERTKRFKCPHCGAIMNRDGVVACIDPVFIKKCETGYDKEHAFKLIQKCDEISNQIHIIGTICREPKCYVNEEKNRLECDFQIATNRNRHILEDDPEKRSDYPWVKTFGERAAEYAEALHVNSSVYINGSLQARKVKRELVCEECCELFEGIDSAVEIIPYSIEYLNNCDIPESEMEEEEKIPIFEWEGDEDYGE